MNVYERSHQRLTGLEAKAVGILQALAIVAAIAAFGLAEANEGSFPALALASAVASLAFGATCLRAVLEVIEPQPKSFVSLNTAAKSREEVCARYAEATAANDVIGIRLNNLFSAALHDLFRTATMAALAVLVTLL